MYRSIIYLCENFDKGKKLECKNKKGSSATKELNLELNMTGF